MVRVGGLRGYELRRGAATAGPEATVNAVEYDSWNAMREFQERAERLDETPYSDEEVEGPNNSPTP